MGQESYLFEHSMFCDWDRVIIVKTNPGACLVTRSFANPFIYVFYLNCSSASFLTFRERKQIGFYRLHLQLLLKHLEH
jgi:hypothetical protein